MVDDGKQLFVWATLEVSILLTTLLLNEIVRFVLTASPKSTFRSALCLIGGGVIVEDQAVKIGDLLATMKESEGLSSGFHLLLGSLSTI